MSKNYEVSKANLAGVNLGALGSLFMVHACAGGSTPQRGGARKRRRSLTGSNDATSPSLPASKAVRLENGHVTAEQVI